MDFSRQLIRYGILLFLFGLFTGFTVIFLKNMRMGLSSHLEGLLNGMFLILLGLFWRRLRLSRSTQVLAFYLALFATYTNWFTTLLSAIWGAGSQLIPIASGNFSGLLWQNILINILLISLSLAITILCFILLWGLRGSASEISSNQLS